MRKALLLGLMLALSAGPAAAAGMQIDFGLTGASPTGSYSDGTDASDAFDAGGGLMGDVLFGISENLFVGGQVGVYQNSGSFIDTDYDMTSVPLHALLQFRTAGNEGFGFFGEAGLGFTSLSIDVNGFSDSFSTSQSGLSFLIGAGVSYALSENWGLTGKFNFHQTQTPSDCDTDDDFFCNDDNPKSILFTLGARWSRQ